MIEVTSLSKQFGGVNAVDDISFSVEPGQVLGFLGPNGAGKSTTMRLITGFYRPSAGEVRVLGKDVHRQRRQVQQHLGYLPEGAPAYGDMRVDHYLDFIARARGLSRAERKNRLRAVSEQLELDAVLKQPVDTLSKGFKRRVGIAQTLVHDPSVLVLDEPTDGLDPNQKQHVRELLRNLAADKTVILSTHILEEVEAVCHRALIIAGGRVRADSTPGELVRQSRYCGAVTLELPNTHEAAAALRSLPETAGIEFSVDNPNRFTLLPTPGAPLFVAVQAKLAGKGWAPQAMSVESGRLDDVFRRITSNDAVEVSL